MATVAYAHIELNAEGRPIISGTRTKVAMIARDRNRRVDAEQIQQRYPYLSLDQIYSALAYCYDHARSKPSALGCFQIGPTSVGPQTDPGRFQVRLSSDCAEGRGF